MCFDVITKMGTESDVTICRISKNEIVVDGDLVVNGVSTKALMKTIEDMQKLLIVHQKRLTELEKMHK